MFWKDGLSKTIALEHDLSYIIRKDDIFPPKISSYSLDGKLKMIFLKKNTWKYDIFFKCPEKMVFPKKTTLEYDLSCTIWKDGIFFPGKYYIFSLDGKWKIILWNMIFSVYMYKFYKYDITLLQKKNNRDDLLPKKYT